ncbi:MAG: hypothetical protein IJW20_04085 [Clostridia bacterium]|nr:hypothetical protein [Clostridia bacterium]
MDFFKEVGAAWKKGSEAKIMGENGNVLSIEDGIKFVKDEAQKFEELSKSKVTEKTINPKTAEERD